MSDDLNSPRAFALIDEVQNESIEFWRIIDSYFGLGLINSAPNITDEIKALLSQREDARVAKNFQLADDIREELQKHNITTKDTINGQVWQYIK